MIRMRQIKNTLNYLNRLKIIMINAIEFYEKRLNIIMKEGELPSELQGRFSYVLQILQMSKNIT